MDTEDVDLMSLEWERLFLNILDRHAPIRQGKVRHNYAPHINSELRRKMFLRDYYKKKHRYTKSEMIGSSTKSFETQSISKMPGLKRIISRRS